MEWMPEGASVEVMHYLPYASVEDVAERYDFPDVDVVVGWSLGGQIAARLVDMGALRPEQLVLIAPAYQYVRSKQRPMGTSVAAFRAFRQAYAHVPVKTLQHFAKLIAQFESRMEVILNCTDQNPAHQKDWLRWLDHLGEFSGDLLPFNNFPPTLLMHGTEDHVTPHQQSLYYQERIPHAEIVWFDAVGHAPHMENTAYFDQIFIEKVLRNNALFA